MDILFVLHEFCATQRSSVSTNGCGGCDSCAVLVWEKENPTKGWMPLVG